MPDPVIARALKNLESLKDGFRDGAGTYQRPGLYHVLVQLAYESCPTESGYVEHPKLHRLPPVPPAYGPKSKLLAAHLPAPCPLFRHYYFGELKGLGKFVELASAAASCVKILAPRPAESQTEPAEAEVQMEWRYEDLVPAFEALGGEHDHDLWPLVVHELAWRRLPGSLLDGQRKVWVEFEDPRYGIRRETAPYEADRFRRYVTSYRDGPPPHWSGVEPPFDHFFSVLPFDIYQGSVYAIGQIMELAEAGLGTETEATSPIETTDLREDKKAQTLDPSVLS